MTVRVRMLKGEIYSARTLVSPMMGVKQCVDLGWALTRTVKSTLRPSISTHPLILSLPSREAPLLILTIVPNILSRM
jgi:hypothetical protein